MTTTIGTLFNVPEDPRTHLPSDLLADPYRFVGIEIELEGMYTFHRFIHPLQSCGFWRYKGDDSLRDFGAEFVTGTHDGFPIRGQDLITAFSAYKKVMKDWSEDTGHTPSCSKRTSVHVHIDVRDMSIDELKKYIMLYVIFEEIFFSWTAPERVRNNYARSSMNHRDVQQMIRSVVGAPDGDRLESLIHNLGRKYDAMNLESITRYGTIEFRIMGGCYDIDHIHKWVNILLAMRLSACNADIEITQIPEHMSTLGMETVFDQVFGQWGEPLRPYATRSAVLKGVRRAQNIIFEDAYDQLTSAFASMVTTDHSLLDDLSESLHKEFKGAK